MQVFIVGSPLETARVLDPKRLRKQIIECQQILDAIKEDECTRYRAHWIEGNVAANMMMNWNKEMQRRGKVRAMYNSLADKTMIYDAAYADKLSDKDMDECKKFFELHYGFNGGEY